MAEDAATPQPSAPAVPLGHRWRIGEVGFPTLVVLLLVLGAAGLGAASIGGWGSVAVLVVLMVAFIGLITSWAVSD